MSMGKGYLYPRRKREAKRSSKEDAGWQFSGDCCSDLQFYMHINDPFRSLEYKDRLLRKCIHTTNTHNNSHCHNNHFSNSHSYSNKHSNSHKHTNNNRNTNSNSNKNSNNNNHSHGDSNKDRDSNSNTNHCRLQCITMDFIIIKRIRFRGLRRPWIHNKIPLYTFW